MAPLTPEAFARRWSNSALSERASYQQHFRDPCEMLGAPKPAEKDPKGEFYAFEKGVEMMGGKGFAAYGWPADIADEDILKNLLALNLERAGSSSPTA